MLRMKSPIKCGLILKIASNLLLKIENTQMYWCIVWLVFQEVQLLLLLI